MQLPSNHSATVRSILEIHSIVEHVMWLRLEIWDWMRFIDRVLVMLSQSVCVRAAVGVWADKSLNMNLQSINIDGEVRNDLWNRFIDLYV